jgi:hypothetical protein
VRPFKVDRYEETDSQLPENLLRIHPRRDTRPWWARVKLEPWSGSEKVRGKKQTYKGIKGDVDI